MVKYLTQLRNAKRGGGGRGAGMVEARGGGLSFLIEPAGGAKSPLCPFLCVCFFLFFFFLHVVVAVYPLQYSCLENSMDREPGGLQSIGSQRVRHD